MDESSRPYKFSYVWAEAATGGYVNTTIPATASGAAASQQLGFPPITAANPGAGGIPPNIADFNGIFYYLSAWAQWQQAGGPVVYDATFSTAIGGYPNGALINAAAGGGKAWLSTVDNNTSDPDTGGADWEALPAAFFPSSLSTNGWKKIPDPNSPSGYFIEQWGEWILPGDGSQQQAVSFPITFPNACSQVQATLNNSTLDMGTIAVYGVSATGFAFGQNFIGGQTGLLSFYWRAVGY